MAQLAGSGVGWECDSLSKLYWLRRSNAHAASPQGSALQDLWEPCRRRSLKSGNSHKRFTGRVSRCAADMRSIML